MPTVSIKWVTSKDDRVCPICKAIDGHVFGPYTEVPDSLVHPAYGEVWNVYLGSLAHEHKLISSGKALVPTCRCHIEPTFDLADLLVKVKKLRDDIKENVTNEEIHIEVYE